MLWKVKKVFQVPLNPKLYFSVTPILCYPTKFINMGLDAPKAFGLLSLEFNELGFTRISRDVGKRCIRAGSHVGVVGVVGFPKIQL